MGKKRLGIFLIYDPDGTVDEYIEYLLDDISPLFAKLIIVCNGFITPESRDTLEKYTGSIFVRENIGFDFRAWKEAMFKYYGYSRVREYDELVLFNDSFFGPFRPFSGVFKEMEERGYDFWGLTVHGEAPTAKNMCPYGYRPRYIQTYFMVFNKRMLNDEEFRLFWQSIPVYSSILEVSEKCSAVLTKFFSDKGYRWGVYSDTADLEESREKNICHHAFNTEELTVNRRYPVIKRKSFILGKKRFLQFNTGLDLPRAVKYIEDNNLYDPDLIFRHIIRRYDAADIKESLNLSYVIDEKTADEGSNPLFDKTVICIHIGKANNISDCLKYIQALQNTVSICIISNSEVSARLAALRNMGCFTDKVMLAEYTGTYIECLILALNSFADKYEYMAFTHDMELAADDAFVAGRTARELLWDNLFSNKDYFGQLLCKLKDNKYLGMLNPVPPMHGKNYTYSVNSKRKWNSYIELWNKVLGDAVKHTDNRKILSAGCSFICKTEALNNLRGISISNNIRILTNNEMCRSAFDNMLPYIVQKNGFLSGWCINSEYAEAEIESARYMIENMFIPDDAGFNASHMSFPVLNNAIKARNAALEKTQRANDDSLRMLAERDIQIKKLKLQLQMMLEYYNSVFTVRIRNGVRGVYHGIRRRLGLEPSEDSTEDVNPADPQ